MQKITREVGFGLVGVAVIVAAILLVGVIGTRVYVAVTGKKNTSTQTSSQKFSANSTAKSDSAKYLDIKELGVKIELSDGIEDATYYYDAAFNAQYPNPKQVTISSKSLADKSGGSCAATSGVGPLGTIQKYSGEEDSFGRPLVADGKTVFKVGDVYLALRTPQAACSSDATILDLAGTQRAAFGEALKTIQSDKQ